MDLTKEQIDTVIATLEKRLVYEATKLNEWGWVETPEGWIDPKDHKIVSSNDAYNWAMCRHLLANGWKSITEVQKFGKPNCDKPTVKRVRFQSPKTNRVYTYLEAATIAEADWDESIWPSECSQNTITRNILIGDNFTGDTIYTWFGRTTDRTLELTDCDGNPYHSDKA